MAAGQGDEFSPIQVEQSTGLNGSHAVKKRSSHCQGHQVRWEGASIRRQRAGSQRGAVALGNPPPQSTLLAMQGGTFSERYGGWVGLKRRERAQQETGRGGNGLGRLRSAHSGKGTGGGPGSVAGCVPSPEEDRDARLEELGKNTEGKTPSGKTPTQPNPYAPEVGGGQTHPTTHSPFPLPLPDRQKFHNNSLKQSWLEGIGESVHFSVSQVIVPEIPALQPLCAWGHLWCKGVL